ncbi:MAG: aminotransferase class I/II-fold pyridoxal phosphate-dependent enzyme [Erysipelotrichaceae bacterium]
MIHELILSDVVKKVQPSGIRKYFDLASSMDNVLSLGVGEPDFDTPWHIREEAIYSLEKGKTFYTGNAGLLELRESIAAYLHRRFELSYNPQTQMIVTVGGSEAIDISLRAIINPGDEVIVLTPAYVAYEPCVYLAYGVVKTIELQASDAFKLTPQALHAAITPKTKAIILNYPSNPTGGIMSREDYLALLPIIKQHQLVVISDEIYAELTYGAQHVSIASFPEIADQVILISGFSKAYSMTGWRLGYVCAHPTLIAAMLKIHQYAIMCPPTMSQYAAIAAMRQGDEDVAQMRESFQQRRNYIVTSLRELGFDIHSPQGAFYAFPSIQSFGLTSAEFCERLLEEERVALVPGSAFGSAGEGFVRISYAYSMEEIKQALERISRFVARWEKLK